MHVFTHLLFSSFLFIRWFLFLCVIYSSIHLFGKLIVLGALWVCVLSRILLYHLPYSINFDIFDEENKDCKDDDCSNANDGTDERICLNFTHLPVVHWPVDSVGANIFSTDIAQTWFIHLVLLEICIIAFCSSFEDQLAHSNPVLFISIAWDVGQNYIYFTDVKPTLIGTNV